MLVYFILKVWFWIQFIINRNSLPTESNNNNPEMTHEGFSGAFIWEDEGLWEHRNHHLLHAFKFVIHERMKIIVGPTNDVRVMRSKRFDKQIYKMAKRHFPNWIGFDESRCSYNPELADKIMRIRKVADWRFQKLLNEEY